MAAILAQVMATPPGAILASVTVVRPEHPNISTQIQRSRVLLLCALHRLAEGSLMGQWHQVIGGGEPSWLPSRWLNLWPFWNLFWQQPMLIRISLLNSTKHTVIAYLLDPQYVCLCKSRLISKMKDWDFLEGREEKKASLGMVRERKCEKKRHHLTSKQITCLDCRVKSVVAMVSLVAHFRGQCVIISDMPTPPPSLPLYSYLNLSYFSLPSVLDRQHEIKTSFTFIINVSGILVHNSDFIQSHNLSQSRFSTTEMPFVFEY